MVPYADSHASAELCERRDLSRRTNTKSVCSSRIGDNAPCESDCRTDGVIGYSW